MLGVGLDLIARYICNGDIKGDVLQGLSCRSRASVLAAGFVGLHAVDLGTVGEAHVLLHCLLYLLVGGCIVDPLYLEHRSLGKDSLRSSYAYLHASHYHELIELGIFICRYGVAAHGISAHGVAAGRVTAHTVL